MTTWFYHRGFRRTRAAVLLLFCSFTLEAATFALPHANDGVVGELKITRAKAKDTLFDIARRHDLGVEELKLANPGLDPWLPGEGTPVVLPTIFILPDGARSGVVVNLAEMRLYYYPPKQRVVVTHPVGIGRVDWETRLGRTTVIAKTVKPAWYPPQSIRDEHERLGDPLPKIVPPGPDNPLGDYALRLGLPGYLIHGTNKPQGVGMRVSHGCLRMYPEDISSLHDSVAIGTPVRIVKQAFKSAWDNDVLYLEAHPLEGEFKLDSATDFSDATRSVVAASRGKASERLDWNRILEVASAYRGVPEPVSLSDRKQSVTPPSGWRLVRDNRLPLRWRKVSVVDTRWRLRRP